MIFTRQNDYEHWVVCPCGWRGFSATMRHDYQGHGNPECFDMEPIDRCPKCGRDESECEHYDVTQNGKQSQIKIPLTNV